MIASLFFVFAIVLGSFVGYWIHRALHKTWAGPFYRGHMEHHLEIYPMSRLTSDTYELKRWYHSGSVLFTPGAVLLLTVNAVVMWLLGVSLWHFTVFGVGLVGFGLLNDWVHDAFHLRVHILQRLSYFRKLRRMHFQHHFDMERNFGITDLSFDRIFKTFKCN